MGGAVQGIVGSLGGTNEFDAYAPQDQFQAQQAQLDTTQYGDAISRARDAAVAQSGGSATADQQARFAQALQEQAAGNGPSLAQRQLETATQQNTAQAAGSIASQKGINPALAARMIQQNQASQNQSAAGQAATLRQSEQLNTQSLLAQELQAQRGQEINQQQANTQLTGTLGQLQQGQNANTIQNTLGAQQIQAGVAEGNANRKLGAQQINAGVAAQNANTNLGVGGTLLGNAGSAMSLAHGGEVSDAEFAAQLRARGAPGYDQGGPVGFWVIPDYQSEQYMRGSQNAQATGKAAGKGISGLSDKLKEMMGGNQAAPQNGPIGAVGSENSAAVTGPGGAVGGAPFADASLPGAADMAGGVGAMDAAGAGAAAAGGAEAGSGLMAAGGMGAVAAEAAPLIETVAEAAPLVAAAAAHGGEIDFRRGGRVPGRATVPGDSPKNDTVPAVVSPGEIVLPRTVAQAPDAEKKAAEFVAAIKAKKKEPTGYGKVLEGQRTLEARLARLEKMADGGEVEGDGPGILERVSRWWNAKSESEKADAGKSVDDKVAQSTPVLANARSSFRKHNSALDDAYATTVGN